MYPPLQLGITNIANNGQAQLAVVIDGDDDGKGNGGDKSRQGGKGEKSRSPPFRPWKRSS